MRDSDRHLGVSGQEKVGQRNVAMADGGGVGRPARLKHGHYPAVHDVKGRGIMPAVVGARLPEDGGGEAIREGERVVRERDVKGRLIGRQVEDLWTE